MILLDSTIENVKIRNEEGLNRGYVYWKQLERNSTLTRDDGKVFKLMNPNGTRFNLPSYLRNDVA